MVEVGKGSYRLRKVSDMDDLWKDGLGKGFTVFCHDQTHCGLAGKRQTPSQTLILSTASLLLRCEPRFSQGQWLVRGAGGERSSQGAQSTSSLSHVQSSRNWFSNSQISPYYGKTIGHSDSGSSPGWCYWPGVARGISSGHSGGQPASPPGCFARMAH